MKWSESFNRSGVSIFLNSPAGRVFRLVAGMAWFALGFVYRGYPLGIFSMVWGLLAFVAGAFDICFISVALGGPISGPKIRSEFQGKSA